MMGYNKRKSKFFQWEKIIISWIFISIILIFISNIFMHIFSYRNAVGYELQLRGNQHYKITDDGQYVPTAEDPQLYYTRKDSSKEMSEVRIEFGKRVEKDFLLELYYSDAQGDFSEERKVEEMVPAGSKRYVVLLPSGQYNAIRLDLNASVYIKEVYEETSQQIMIYADKIWRYRIWGVCVLVALILSVVFYHSEKIWNRWQKVYQSIMGFFSNIYHSKEIRKLIVILCLGIILGLLAEGAIVLFAHRAFNSRETAILSIICALILSFVFFKEIYRKRLEIAFLAVFLGCGAVFLYVTPVSLGIAWDDETHYNKMISVARMPGKNLTRADKLLLARFADGIWEVERYKKANRESNEKLYNETYQEGIVDAMDYKITYQDVAYLPFVMGIWTAYGLGLSFCATMIFGRLFNLLFIGMLLYYSIRNVRSGKMLILVFATIPTVFFLISSYSYDSWLTFMLLYAFCRYFGELQKKDETLTFSRFLGIFIPAFIALLPKIVYAPMLFLMAYMPKEKFKEKKWCMAYRSCFLFAGLVVVLAILYVASGKLVFSSVGDTRGGADVNQNLQLQYIIHNFGTYCNMLRQFLRYYLSYANCAQYLTFMAYMGLVNMPYISIGLFTVAALWDRSDIDRKTIPLLSKVGAVIMPVIIAAICATVMYLAFTPVGYGTVNGCQGRYLLPAILPSVYMISRCGILTGIKKKIPVEIVNMILLGVSICFLMYNLWVNCAVKYIL